MTDKIETSARVVVALEPSAPHLAVLDIVRHLIADKAPELYGLLIENLEPLELAGSRLAREIVSSGESRPLQAEILTRQLRAQSSLLKQRFESEAARYGWSCSSEISHRDVFSELARHAGYTETLAVNFAVHRNAPFERWQETIARIAAGSVRRLLLAREDWKSEGSILVLSDNADPEERAVALGQRVARQSRSHLFQLNPADEPAGGIISIAQKVRAQLIVVHWSRKNGYSAMLNRLLKETCSSLLLVR